MNNCFKCLKWISEIWHSNYICDALRDLVHLYNLKNVKNAHGGVLFLVKLQASLQLY